MKTIKREKKLCLQCMEDHEVQIVVINDTTTFKSEDISYDAIYEYCDHCDEFLQSEEMIRSNHLAMKDAYRQKVGLLTSKEIIAIREKYKISQKAFSKILDWGEATITRYENHHIQDQAHDCVLRIIDSDPKRFQQLLIKSKDKISKAVYDECYEATTIELSKMENSYLIDYIVAKYSRFDDLYTGGTHLNLTKIIDIINYFASKVNSLHKVKLMKMLWYSDALNYKNKGVAMTGLAYKALKMGAVPVGANQILDLNGVTYETLMYNENIAYKFSPTKNYTITSLSKEDIKVLDSVIAAVGKLNAEDISSKMHDEDAYQYTNIDDLIPFSYASTLSIDV